MEINPSALLLLISRLQEELALAAQENAALRQRLAQLQQVSENSEGAT